MSFRIADRNRRGGTITINKILINKTEKMKVKKVLTLAIIAVCSMGMVSCTAETKKTKKAFLDMFDFYGVPFTPLMEKDIWFTDFGLGDFEHVGMGGIFWINDPEYGYFAHNIYLLPGQMIPEHAHVKTKFPAKHESWMVNHGWVYNFSELGDETPNAPEVPASHGPIKSKNFVVQKVGDVLRLKQLESYHFMMAGPEGAIVEEWACYHDNDGLRFTNTKAAL